MRIRGSIRRGPGGIDVAFVHDDVWHNLTDSPLKTNIEQLYNFLLSKEERGQLFGRIYRKQHNSSNGNPNTSVRCRTGLCDFTLTRYEKTRDGQPSPSDRVAVEMVFQTTSESTELFADFESGED